ncbi:bifunctional UDP-N-acetylglucosamine diphosphorylase/glucosamine-1-phosphate N-acetyltransferase GlmU [uncultured Campylobacter sp.]|uniref:bifunctional UDP-N-acetylglucosamine diphosphorylase/glucosamine-1-phosphate N-acetyltransferase GlmU n=1 Tax=uncultured Campylobacter sp. TaxID=218934 RepID=UPI002631E479|nr:bifunctional UDP-N-acetylglucosamine diphosphorylase/glucosamine-1-phosphate N-acetyltransferase GlmU [uncultured Campylobacter sp.]
MISLILAAGKGTRMKSEQSKVLHKVNGVTMIKRVVNVLENIGNDKNIFILGHKKEDVLAEMGNVDYVTQEEQLGTGHAVLIAKDKIQEYGEDVLITYGDTPLLKEETLEELKKVFEEKNLDCIVLSCKVKNPFGYGRIVKENGKISNIVEEKEANEKEKKIDEINTGVYIFKNESLLYAIEKIDNNNSKGEYYLTDAIKILTNENYNVDSFQIEDEDEILGVNSKVQLAQADKILRNRKNIELMDSGVILIDPDNVEIGQDTVIYPNVTIQGNTKIGKNCEILGNTRIENSVIADNVKIEASVVEQSTLEEGVTVGPFAHLRPKAYLKETVHVGNFVEIKNATLEKGVKTGHLTYIGDAEIGEDTNVGAGTITCNYDGKNKHKTKIGKNAFIGSNSIIVAPVEIGDKVLTAAGSVITKNIPNEALAFGRAKQVNKEKNK